MTKGKCLIHIVTIEYCYTIVTIAGRGRDKTLTHLGIIRFPLFRIPSTYIHARVHARRNRLPSPRR